MILMQKYKNKYRREGIEIFQMQLKFSNLRTDIINHTHDNNCIYKYISF